MIIVNEREQVYFERKHQGPKKHEMLIKKFSLMDRIIIVIYALVKKTLSYFTIFNSAPQFFSGPLKFEFTTGIDLKK
jgi:hypothetical protein